MTIAVQYSRPSGWSWTPPVPTVTTGQQIGARLLIQNENLGQALTVFTVKKKLLDPSGIQVAYEEETRNVAFGLLTYFPITTVNTSKAGNYTADFQIYIGSVWYASWKGSSLVTPFKLIAIVTSPVIPPPDLPDDEGTPTPTPSGDLTYTKIGEATVKSVEAVQQLQSWNTAFKSGEHGLIKMTFPIPLPADIPNWLVAMLNPFSLLFKQYSPELSKAGIADYLNSYLPAKGVKLWKAVYWEGDKVCIPFITGIAPLVIIAIAVGVALIVGTVLITVALWKVGIAYVEAEKEKELEGQDQILKAIGGVDDPDVQAALLLKYLNLKAAGDSNEGIWAQLFKTPLLVVGIAIAVCLVAVVAIKVIRR